MHRRIARRYLWLALNVAGGSTYLLLASRLWVQPGEEGQPGGPGDAFYWLFALAPILFAYATLDAAALVAILRRAVRDRALSSSRLALWIAAAAMWVGVVAYDYHRSVRYIDAKYTVASARRADA